AGWLTNGAEYAELPTMTKYRPGPMAFDIASGKWLLTTVHGQPKDDRGSIAMALTETEVIFLGGQDGPGFPVVHNDGYRLPLNAAGKKGVIP
ncbi:MAG: hypothetical protein AAB654_17630, partial [Acidobacteriota bacterium]